jgi:hypothetical chaperone protein
MEMPVSAVCAIDFGTSNSAVALPSTGRCELVELEPGHVTMPTAVFYAVEGHSMFQQPKQHYGRAAVAAYLEGTEGRLMRSMKSILGSPLATQTTDVGGGHGVAYVDVITSYLRHLKAMAERQAQCAITRAVLGRPVYFVDDDAQRDAAAQAALKLAAEAVGFEEVTFQYEPIAAALDYESTIECEQLVLVVDIGGGTSDFSLVRVGPERRQRMDRRDDVLANHGVHIAGTDFDRQIDLEKILPTCGFRGMGPNGREVPSGVYFDLATWHLINTVYSKGRVAELKRMKSFYADESQYRRLITVIDEHLGHELMGRAEAAKIDVSKGGHTVVDLSILEPGLSVPMNEDDAIAAIGSDLERIALAATETLRQAGLAPDQVDALYLTGGSTGFNPLVAQISAQFPAAKLMRGDPFGSVALGLGLHARRLFGTPAQ